MKNSPLAGALNMGAPCITMAHFYFFLYIIKSYLGNRRRRRQPWRRVCAERTAYRRRHFVI